MLLQIIQAQGVLTQSFPVALWQDKLFPLRTRSFNATESSNAAGRHCSELLLPSSRAGPGGGLEALSCLQHMDNWEHQPGKPLAPPVSSSQWHGIMMSESAEIRGKDFWKNGVRQLHNFVTISLRIILARVKFYGFAWHSQAWLLQRECILSFPELLLLQNLLFIIRLVKKLK